MQVLDFQNASFCTILLKNTKFILHTIFKFPFIAFLETIEAALKAGIN